MLVFWRVLDVTVCITFRWAWILGSPNRASNVYPCHDPSHHSRIFQPHLPLAESHLVGSHISICHDTVANHSRLLPSVKYHCAQKRYCFIGIPCHHGVVLFDLEVRKISNDDDISLGLTDVRHPVSLGTAGCESRNPKPSSSMMFTKPS